MSENASSDSDTQETDSNPSSSEELESPKNGGTQKMSSYEKQRAKRIEENRARMEALGLRKMACSLMGSVPVAKKREEAKGKAKAKRGEEDDEEYRPPEESEEDWASSSSGEDGESEGTSGGRRGKAKRKHSTPKKKFFDQNLTSNSDFVDDDEALLQAIALSLKGSTECSDVRPNEHSRSSAHLSDSMINTRKEKAHVKQNTGNWKRKKQVTSRVKMTEDEFLIHFFQFDEAGGGITRRDLKRVAAAHDFTWTDKEMADMICCFDSDGDGKLSLDDFRKIAGQCNMI